MKERRIYQRSPIELAASYGMPEEDHSLQIATVINISAGGFCFSTNKKIKSGTNIKLSVQLSPKKKINVDVRAVWVKKIGDTGNSMIGVQIINTEGADFEKFLDFYCEQVKKVSQEVKH